MRYVPSKPAHGKSFVEISDVARKRRRIETLLRQRQAQQKRVDPHLAFQECLDLGRTSSIEQEIRKGRDEVYVPFAERKCLAKMGFRAIRVVQPRFDLSKQG